MRKIGNKLAITFGLLILSAIFVCGWYLYGQTKHYLDKELGGRLVDIAQTVATHSNGAIIIQLVPGNETGLTYRNLVSQLNRIKRKTAVKRIYIFDENRRSLVDTEMGIPIGTEYLKLKFDQLELERVWQKEGTASVLFLGEDGEYYKSGYAPILVDDKVVAAVGVDASATFLQILKRFRHNVLTFGLVCVIISAAIGFVLSKTITNPIYKLVAAAEKIGKGDFNTEIGINSKDEIGYLTASPLWWKVTIQLYGRLQLRKYDSQKTPAFHPPDEDNTEQARNVLIFSLTKDIFKNCSLEARYLLSQADLPSSSIRYTKQSYSFTVSYSF